MPNSKPNYFQRRTKFKGPRANERIRALDVQVIGSSGSNLGVLPLKNAIELAKQEDLDLIEISPNANPPVCKIMDMGKYKYDIQKKANQAKKKQKIVSLKEIKLRPKGDKVKFTVRFKGREMQHTDLGKELMNKIIEETKDIAKVESQPKFEGKQMVMIIQPI